MASFDISHTSSYSSSTVVAVSFTVFLINRDIGRKTLVFHTPLPFRFHDHLEPLGFFSKNLIQTIQVHELLDGAGRTNVTDDRQTTDGRLMP